ncbi:MAG: radical SAM family heme chaperone HemW, partial [Anaerolineales bacterium]|nr:radical SAM family heme chaperone HemW [Anaerolineales bacterium]
ISHIFIFALARDTWHLTPEHMTQSHSLYLHIPFCRHRCAYCDFNTYAGQEDLIPAYVNALCNEICTVALATSPRLRVHTIFFGGGTPSLLTAGQFEKILAAIRENFDVLFDAEISLEANPGTISLACLLDLHRLGFNRLSFGIQSAHADELRQLERIHNFFDVIEAVKWARMAGFDNLNLDLIYGLPEQSLDRWQATVKLALSLHPEHLSLYALTLEHGTPFGRWSARGRMPSPDPDLAADMYEWAGEYLAAHGYEQYEISNWAKTKDEGGRLVLPAPVPQAQVSEGEGMKDEFLPPSFACRHNLQYWRNQTYLGFGAGAHGWAGGYRYSNVLRIKTYIERLTKYQFPKSQSTNLPCPRSPATCSLQPVNLRTQMQETMLLGLRLTREGVSASAFQARFGIALQEAFGREVDELVGLGLLEWMQKLPSPSRSPTGVLPPTGTMREGAGGEVLRLTKRGRLLGNQVFMRFVG